MAQQIQIRNDTTAGWETSNPILAQGEFGVNTTNGEFKIGDGSTHWLDLPYHGTSLTDLNLIKAGLWNYPSNNGVVIQTAQHNESIAIKSNQSAALRWHIRDDGSFVGSDSLVILSHNQPYSDGSAVGFNITQREVPPVVGHYYYVNINTGDTRFNGQYLCTDSTTNIIQFDYGQDVSSYDTTNLTGTIGLPSIYNQVESRPDGVWVKNANWSDPVGYAHYWRFKTDGTTQFPYLPSNSRTGSGEVLQFSDPGNQSIITGPPTTEGSPTATRFVIAGQDSFSSTSGEGGDIYLWAGRGQDGGDIKLDGGNSLSNGQGGTVKMRGGYSPSGNGGFVEILSGDSSSANGGYIDIIGGSSGGTGTSGGTVSIVGGYAYGQDGRGGSIDLYTYQDANISLNPTGIGNVVIGNTIRPSADNSFSLGTPDFRWSSVHIGPGTLYLTDQTLNTDAAITVNNGVFNIGGIAQAQLPNIAVTNLTFADNTVQTTAAKLLYNGSFEDTTTQVSSGTTSATLVKVNTTTTSNGVSVDNNDTNSKITFTTAGDYHVNFLGQFKFSGGASSYDVTVWYAKNGTLVPNSASTFTLTSAQGSQTMANFTDIISVNAGDYIQFYWYTSVAPSAGPNGIYLYSAPAGTNPTRPASRSVKINIFNVG